MNGGTNAPPRYLDALLDDHPASRLRENKRTIGTAVAMQYVDAWLVALFVLLAIALKGEMAPRRPGGHGCVGRAGSTCHTSMGRVAEKWRRTRVRMSGMRSAASLASAA